MHRFAGVSALLCTVILLLSLAGCGSASATADAGQNSVTVITARRRAETAEPTPLADEKDNLPFFSGTSRTAADASAADGVGAAAEHAVSSAPAETARTVQPTTAGYVCNTSSKKFHLPTCGSVKTISDKNREDYSGLREDLIARGYSPCKKCNP